ncbi:MAG: DUF951 domain-containing protein [Bacillota bacterium]|jgi:hypothetical protein|nr:DUF951 domain-containing protein [Bacillota bacterium]NLU53920.1 DUF951 domain-containing protein [Bacillota bacterium]HOA91581.1 DUF951 domain-containing protein [Bacillota bacterium]HOJ46278.1 DUF951 domain-containing protein [Bacillota bacterium]HOL13626.1 DUF951 domain-containing protein [Bacillota bacterium]
MSPGKFYVGDVVRMRKPHPCGGNTWEVMRVGMDFRIRCLTCDRVVLIPRVKFEKGLKEVIQRGPIPENEE